MLPFTIVNSLRKVLFLSFSYFFVCLLFFALFLWFPCFLLLLNKMKREQKNGFWKPEKKHLFCFQYHGSMKKFSVIFVSSKFRGNSFWKICSIQLFTLWNKKKWYWHIMFHNRITYNTLFFHVIYLPTNWLKRIEIYVISIFDRIVFLLELKKENFIN